MELEGHFRTFYSMKDAFVSHRDRMKIGQPVCCGTPKASTVVPPLRLHPPGTGRKHESVAQGEVRLGESHWYDSKCFRVIKCCKIQACFAM